MAFEPHRVVRIDDDATNAFGEYLILDQPVPIDDMFEYAVRDLVADFNHVLDHAHLLPVSVTRGT